MSQTQQPMPGPPPGPAMYGDVELLPALPSIAKCPPGLEYLDQLDQVVVKQVVELFEALTGFETKNRYRMLNTMGQQFAFGHEESSCFQRFFCAQAREFTYHVTDNNNQEIMRLYREFKCCAGCSWCACSNHCAWEMFINAPADTPIGSVRMEQTCWSPSYTIRDPTGSVIASIAGPATFCCLGPCESCNSVAFEVTDTQGSKIATISRVWGDAAKECFTTASTYNLTFTSGLPPVNKALILSATFLIDMMYYEQKDNNQ